MEAQSLHKINDISALLVKTPGKPGNFKGILEHIARIAQEAFGTDACVILAFNPITGKYIGNQTIMGNTKANIALFHESPRPNGVSQQVLQDGTLFIENLDNHSLYENRFTREEDIRSFAGLALRTRHRKRPLGVIYLDFKQPKKFSPIEREIYQIFAVQAAFLLQETWLAQHYEQVARIGQDINHNLATVEALFGELQTYVDAILDESHTLSLAVLQPQTNTLDVYMSEQGQNRVFNTSMPGAYHHVIESQQSLFLHHASEQCTELPFKVNEIIGAEGKESLILVPLMLRDVPLGVLSVQFAEPNTYGQEDLLILQLLASYTALGLHNIRLYSGLHQLNETGQLLTQHLESEQTLQSIVDQIRDVTQADVAILCPYESARHRFVTPPRVAGTLLDSNVEHLMSESPEDITLLMLQQKKPIFAKECAHLYSELRSGAPIHKRNFQEREQICSTVALPLLVEDEVVGVMFLNFRTSQRFDATQKLLIEGLAHYAAIAIKNAQVFGTLSSRRTQELEILRKIDRELSRTLELKAVLQTLLNLAHEYVPADEASILLHNPRTYTLEPEVAIGRNTEASQKQSISLRETKGITRWVVEEKKAIRVNNVRSELPWREIYVPIADDTISELDVPLMDGDTVIGVLNFESTKEGAFHQEDEDFLITLAGQAVLAIKNAQAYEREKRFAAEGRVLNEISKEIISQLDTDHIFGLILKNALEQTRASVGHVMIYDSEQNDLWMATEEGIAQDKKKLRHSLDEGVVGQVARTRQLLNVDLSQQPWKDINLDMFPGTRTELAVPMLAGDDLRGVLNVESLSANNFTESDERLLKGLADLAVIALQNAQVYEREKRLAAESQVLNEISKEITSQLDSLRVFDLILEKALELTDSTLGTLNLYDDEANELYIVTERGATHASKDFRQKLQEGIVGYAARSGHPINVADVLYPPWNEFFLAFFPGSRSELAIPMFEGNDLRGVLNVESPLPHNFDENDQRLLQGLADLAVVALQNAERYKKAEKEAERFKLLYQAGQELSKITDLEQIEQAYEVVVQIADTQSQSQIFIYRYDEEIENAEFTLCFSSLDRHAPLFATIGINEGVNGHVARTLTKLLINDTHHLPPDIPAIKLSAPQVRSLLIIPILFKDQYYGNLGLRHEEVGHFRSTDILFFEWLAQELASTIHRLETVKARQEFEQRAQAAEEMSSIGQSAFEVTHRLGNDLGLVELYVADIRTELEKNNVTNSVVSAKLDNILHSVQKVLSFSRNLRQHLARLGEKEQTAGDPVMVSPRELLDEAAIVPTLPLTIEIAVDVDEDVAQVMVLRPLVADILRNLVTNAIQAMPSGGKLTLRAHNAGHNVAFKVCDTGTGIPRKKQANIFDLFFSSKDSSGFGLWSARRNALKNHGNLTEESTQGKGTTFTLLLPKTNRRTS